MSSVNVDYDFSDILNSIEKMVDDINKVESKATLEGAKEVKKALEANTPKSNEDHDHMVDNIKIGNYKENGDGVKSREVGYGKLQYKANWLEFGTSKMQGIGLLTKAMQESKSNVERAINEELNKIFGKLGR
ncbi:MAG: HK97 gp10 family phage protein [Vallitaleaceae bacterium]|nr:HK97 gp10 family phage protein [Vallitaleaceae bacterium]